MGMNTSLMRGKGLSTSQVLSLAMNKLYKQFVEKNVKEFEAFHAAILDTFNTINMAVPGKHYDAPSYKDVKEIFKCWEESNEEDQKEMFIDFLNKNVNLNKVDESVIITAIVAPPAAMLAKRTGQRTLPQLKFMNVIPDVVFVPSATVLALIAVKILRLMFIGNGTTSKVATGSFVDHAVQPLRLDNILPSAPLINWEFVCSLMHSFPISLANVIRAIYCFILSLVVGGRELEPRENLYYQPRFFS